MTQKLSAETLALIAGIKKALGTPDDDLRKSITVGTGLTAYDLQAPAKNLYPVQTPIRNSIPRVSGGTGPATNWRQVTAITGSGYNASPWVPEGQRTARMSYTAASKSASYVTIGEEDQVSFEAESAGMGFEDVRATAAIRLLQKMMIKEEDAIIGGNASVSLGTPTTPTLSASGSGGTLGSATYSVIVVALTYEGLRNATLTAPLAIPTSQTITGADGLTYSLNGGSSQKSAAATQAVTLGQTLFCSTPVVNGAVAYAWFVGTAGSEKLEKVTYINSATFSAPLAGTGQAATTVTADSSKNASLAFDGLLAAIFNNSASAYIASQATGTAGTGTPLTASGRGSISEIDLMLLTMWNNYKVSPTVLYMNAQELQNISNKVLSNASGPLLRYTQAANEQAAEYRLTASGIIDFYFNPFTLGGGMKIPLKLHPTIPPGTIFGYCENLPAQYVNNHVPNVAEIKTRRDYYQLDWPLRTRQYEFGVYAEEVLAVYAPFAMGLITNIANG